jgi:hypothetical protein
MIRPAILLALATAATLAACGKDSNEVPNPVSVSTLKDIVNADNIEARTSQIVTDGSGPSQVFDDVTFDEDGTFTKVGWQGAYCVQATGSAAPDPTATGFTVSLYPDNAGKPDLAHPVVTHAFALADAHQTFVDTWDGLSGGTAPNTTWSLYQYSATLPTPVTVTGGTRYWLSVQATTPSYAVYFGWTDGTPVNSSSLQLFDGTYTTFPVDRAYSFGS